MPMMPRTATGSLATFPRAGEEFLWRGAQIAYLDRMALLFGPDCAVVAQGASVHVTFFEVFAACDGGGMRPDAGALRGLIAAHKGDFCECNPLDGQERNYIELGGWLGSQETALRFIGLAHLLGLGKCMSPDTMMPFLDSGTKMSMAQAGMVTFKADGA